MTDLCVCMKDNQSQSSSYHQLFILMDFFKPVLPVSLGLQAESSLVINNIYHFFVSQIDRNCI